LLHLYEHMHQVKLQALEHIVQTPLYAGPFDHEYLMREVVIWHNGLQQGPCLVEVAFIPTTQVFNFMVDEGQDGGWCQFLCKKCVIHLDNDLQQLWIDNAYEFSRFKFWLPWRFYPQDLHVYYTCCIIHKMVLFTILWISCVILLTWNMWLIFYFTMKSSHK
jgi:hypothetical protein